MSRFDVLVVPEVLDRLHKDLHLAERHEIRVEPPRDENTRGQFDPNTGDVHLYVGSGQHQLGRLTDIKRQIIKTLLHEFRHAYQFEKWSRERLHATFAGDYNNQTGEYDAREFASKEWINYKDLVQLKPRSNSRRRLP